MFQTIARRYLMPVLLKSNFTVGLCKWWSDLVQQEWYSCCYTVGCHFIEHSVISVNEKSWKRDVELHTGIVPTGASSSPRFRKCASTVMTKLSPHRPLTRYVKLRAWRTCRDVCRCRKPAVTGEMFPSFSACATRNFTYLIRGPYAWEDGTWYV